MQLTSLLAAASAVTLASARIVGLAPFGDFGQFLATNESTFELRFLTLNSQQPHWDWSAAVGIRPANETADETALGTWLANVDFVALEQDLTGNGNFTVEIPMPSSAFKVGTGPYVLTAAVLSSFDATLLQFHNMTFTAEVSSDA
ncbi:hypothetical protein AURDEDRAFT_168398 [Auricularia subglabra TFB-10046 SS5]|nr:hypothetical protein AURDEDRAFT_168398 [Auricularia subglabra TFB-10046 SS5]